jgi:hypothetical protein
MTSKAYGRQTSLSISGDSGERSKKGGAEKESKGEEREKGREWERTSRRG